MNLFNFPQGDRGDHGPRGIIGSPGPVGPAGPKVSYSGCVFFLCGNADATFLTPKRLLDFFYFELMRNIENSF